MLLVGVMQGTEPVLARDVERERKGMLSGFRCAERETVGGIHDPSDVVAVEFHRDQRPAVVGNREDQLAAV